MSISSATPDPDLTVQGAAVSDARVCTLILLGASGDLAKRLLMPALGKLLAPSRSAATSSCSGRAPRTGTPRPGSTT
jgi:hypothetical protein